MSSSTFTALANPVTDEAGAPTEWLDFAGRWGDPQLPDGQDGQIDLLGQRKYTAGPTGPRDKRLDREEVCNVDNGETCTVKKTLIGAK